MSMSDFDYRFLLGFKIRAPRAGLEVVVFG